MFIVNLMPAQISPNLVTLLEKCEVATIGHVLHSGFVDREIRAVLPSKRVAGTAVTIRIPHADSTALHYLTKLVRAGDVVVIDRCGDTKHAAWGGVVTHAMKMAGVKAGVIDGPVLESVSAMGFTLTKESKRDGDRAHRQREGPCRQ